MVKKFKKLRYLSGPHSQVEHIYCHFWWWTVNLFRTLSLALARALFLSLSLSLSAFITWFTSTFHNSTHEKIPLAHSLFFSIPYQTQQSFLGIPTWWNCKVKGIPIVKFCCKVKGIPVVEFGCKGRHLKQWVIEYAVQVLWNMYVLFCESQLDALITPWTYYEWTFDGESSKNNDSYDLFYVLLSSVLSLTTTLQACFDKLR